MDLVVLLPIVLCPCHLIMSVVKHKKDKHKKEMSISKESEEVESKWTEKEE